MDWDVFISHAWEDKDSFARPLAKALQARGLKVWFDEFTLTVGDGLRRSIDYGLANSRYGIVILSPKFFAKEWPQKELDGLASREVSGVKVILPVWHDITADQIRKYSPTLADRVAVTSRHGLEYVVVELLRAMESRNASKIDKAELHTLPIATTEELPKKFLDKKWEGRIPFQSSIDLPYSTTETIRKKIEVEQELKRLLRMRISEFIRELEAFDKQHPSEVLQGGFLDWEKNREKQNMRAERLHRLKQKIEEFLADSVSRIEANRFSTNCSALGGYSLDLSRAKAYLTVLDESIMKGEVEISPSRRRRRRL
jgi:hypothetical protein